MGVVSLAKKKGRGGSVAAAGPWFVGRRSPRQRERANPSNRFFRLQTGGVGGGLGPKTGAGAGEYRPGGRQAPGRAESLRGFRGVWAAPNEALRHFPPGGRSGMDQVAHQQIDDLIEGQR